jgi:O-antigen ligase
LIGDKRFLLFSLFLPLLAFFLPSVKDRVMDLFWSDQFRTYEGENSFAWRLAVWRAAFPWILKSPWGYGLTSFLPFSSQFFETKEGVGAHNVYLELLFEAGLLGFLSYLSIYAGILRRLWKSMKYYLKKDSTKYAIVFAYVISYLIINVADNLLYYLAFNWYFWFFIGLILLGMEQGKSDGSEAIVSGSKVHL